jgi:hypothetical protein
MSVREVFPGSTSAGAAAEYIELQMYASGQNFVNGHEVRLYSANGMGFLGPNFTADVPNGANQQTILVATPDAEDGFGIDADLEINNADELDPSGGAVCWEDIDCVSWGNFTGEANLPSPSGTPTPAISDGMSLTRSIAPSCPTALDAADDTDNSAADFLLASPNPRNNASPITETTCGTGGAGGGSSGSTDNTAPNTKIKRRPPNRSRDDTPTYKFKSTEAGSKFKCKVDHRRYRKCRSPKTLHGLDPGPHTFKVRATDKAGNTDKTPAKDRFKILEG